ncbi:MAG: RidA family protein [Alphaproteobacteria bacterium]|nr:RidA family protein [Alphaproteobacteria bacterium]MCB1839577.1 RidA family protein [Alphaproteobacteria bacterium]
MNLLAKLKELGHDLPEAASPAANYVPFVISGKSLHIAGQIPFLNGQPMHKGRLGEDLTKEEGVKAAEACALNILAQVNKAVDGDWSKVARCVRLGVFVNSTPDFTDQPEVANGASNLIAAVMGEAGKHARAAVGVASLPRGVAVEVDALFELK